jgi:hypothetical protein
MSVMQIARKKGFLNKTAHDTEGVQAKLETPQGDQHGGNVWDDIGSFFGGDIKGDHKYYGVTKAHYNRAVAHHKQHGGSFWSSLKSVAQRVAKTALPILSNLPGPVGMAANVAQSLIPGLAPDSQEGSGLSKAHYARAKKHYKQHGCGWMDAVKATIAKGRALAAKIAPHIATAADIIGKIAQAPPVAAAPAAQAGSGLKKLTKGSEAAKARMASLRALKKSKGAGLF